jgi:hypothetical protein
VSLLEGFPTPRTSRALLATPQYEVELARWSRIVSGLGVEMEPAELGDWAVSVSDSVNAVHDRLLVLAIFPFGTLALYPVFFHHDELARGLARLRRRGSESGLGSGSGSGSGSDF